MANPLNIKVSIGGLAELRDMLTDVAPKEANNILRSTVHGLAGQVRDRMKQRVKKRSRSLEKSIKAVRRRAKEYEHISDVRGGRGAPYGFMLEFGTVHTPAQPFIVPTVEEMRPNMARHYREEFGKQLERVLARRAKLALK